MINEENLLKQSLRKKKKNQKKKMINELNEKRI